MIKHKAIKLFLILGMLLFSFFGVVGCSNEKVFEKKLIMLFLFLGRLLIIALSVQFPDSL